MPDYLLAETMFIIEGNVENVSDTRIPGKEYRYAGAPMAVVSQTVSGDRSHGRRKVEPPSRGDTEYSFSFAADQRLSSVSYKSTGVGSKVVGAAVKTLAIVVGAAARVASVAAGGVGGIEGLGARTLQRQDHETDKSKIEVIEGPPSPAAVRAAWAETESGALAEQHRSDYTSIATTVTKDLLGLNQQVLQETDPTKAAQLFRRIRQLQGVASSALGEISKAEGLFEAWSSSGVERISTRVSWRLALDELPVHDDALSKKSQKWQPDARNEVKRTWDEVWQELGIRIEVGGSPIDPSWRPNADGVVSTEPDKKQVYWRVPRMARVWVWRRAEDESETLESVADTWVTDRFSHTESLPLTGRFFGESAAELVLDDFGQPSRIGLKDTSAVGAIAEAISGAPEQFVAGVDAVSKASATLTGLGDAAAERKLAAIKRQVSQRTQELELQGLNATADDFAKLKTAQQKVAMLEADGALAPLSELSKLQNELAGETGSADLEKVQRERQLASDLSSMQAEIAGLEAQLRLAELRAELPGSP